RTAWNRMSPPFNCRRGSGCTKGRRSLAHRMCPATSWPNSRSTTSGGTPILTSNAYSCLLWTSRLSPALPNAAVSSVRQKKGERKMDSASFLRHRVLAVAATSNRELTLPAAKETLPPARPAFGDEAPILVAGDCGDQSDFPKDIEALLVGADASELSSLAARLIGQG